MATLVKSDGTTKTVNSILEEGFSHDELRKHIDGFFEICEPLSDREYAESKAEEQRITYSGLNCGTDAMYVTDLKVTVKRDY